MIFFLFDDTTEPADIFAEIPSEKTSPPSGAPAAQAPTTPLPVGESGVILQQAAFGKKGLILLVVGVLVIGGAIAAFFAWRASQPSVQPITDGTPQPQPEPSQEQPQPVLQPQPEPEPQVQNDTDGDGLSDTREGQLGTNAGLVDTDNDGLSDREEVEIYLTNPVNPDTDGDTYKDGDEVKNGYDPKGPGKLLQIPPA